MTFFLLSFFFFLIVLQGIVITVSNKIDLVLQNNILHDITAQLNYQ